MTSKPEDICSKISFNKIKKCEGFIDYKIIRGIHCKIQENTSTIQSELGVGQHGLLGLAMQPFTYQIVTGKEFQSPYCPPKVAPVTSNAAADEVPRYIQHHAAQVDQWGQMLNVEYILKKQLLDSLEEKDFKGQSQAYINYTNRKIAGLIQHLYYYHGTISPMDIEES